MRSFRIPAIFVLLLPGAAAASAPPLVEEADYADTFTAGANGRSVGFCCDNGGGAYDIESRFSSPPAAWTPLLFMFADPASATNPPVMTAARGNPGAASGFVQTGSFDVSLPYGLRKDFVVQVDAFVSASDRTHISSLPAAGDPVGTPGSLTVFFRRASVGPLALFDGSVETPVTDGAGEPVRLPFDDDDWHDLAVRFDGEGARLEAFVDGSVVASVDLASFAGGRYRAFSNGAVGVGGNGVVDDKVLCFDNFLVGSPRPILIGRVDASDTFTLGGPGRTDGLLGDNSGGAYDVERADPPAASAWQPWNVWSFNGPSSASDPATIAAAAGNLGASGGFAQTGGGDASFAYGLRTSYVVQMEAILSPGDRIDISSVPFPGAGIFSSPSLSVFFRKDSVAGTPHPAFPGTGLPGLGVFDGSVETAVTDDGGSPIILGIDDDDWHDLAVGFDQDGGTLEVFVDFRSAARLDLTAFAGGRYRSWSNGAVGFGGAGASGARAMWIDNFQVGAPSLSTRACFSVEPVGPIAGSPARFDAACSVSSGAALACSWDLGDGTTAEGPAIDHAYAAPGDYIVRLTVRDGTGTTDVLERTVTVGAPFAPFADCFERAEGPVTGWTVVGGTWGIDADGMVAGDTIAIPDDEAFLYAGDPPLALGPEFILEVDWQLLEGTTPGVGRHAAVNFFWNEATDNRFNAGARGYTVFYIDRVSDRGFSLLRFQSGSYVVLNGPGGTPDMTEPPRRLRIEVQGSRIRALGDGTLLFEVEDSTYRDGLLALWTYSGTRTLFDDFRLGVTDLPGCGEARFRRGDADGGGSLDLTDAISILEHLFLGGPAPACADAADGDDSGALDLTDAIFVLRYLFLGGDRPPAPGPEGCGPDPTEDGLGCGEPPDCP